MANRHAPECIARQNAQVAWVKRWPGHCRKCGGWGGGTHYEMHGFNHGAGEYQWVPCEQCIERDVCPRCGKHAVIDDDRTTTCRECGWDLLNPDGGPEVDCSCWEEWERHQPKE